MDTTQLLKFYYAAYTNERTEYRKLGHIPSQNLKGALAKIPSKLASVDDSSRTSANSSFKYISSKQVQRV